MSNVLAPPAGEIVSNATDLFSIPISTTLLNSVTVEYNIKQIHGGVLLMATGATGALLKYVVHVLTKNSFTKFHFTKVNRIVEKSHFNVTVAPPVGKIL